MVYSAPYYAVIFVSTRTEGDNGYGRMADRMVELAKGMPGFLGIDSVRDKTGLGITVSYWQDEASIAGWRTHAEHKAAQETGKRQWYAHYDLHVAKVERSYSRPTGK
jgi:heme-degrading monooxygenase HmoA